MDFLISLEPFRFSERTDDNANGLLRKFACNGDHLAQVLLARQSGEVTQANEQQSAIECQGKLHGLAVEIHDGKVRKIDAFAQGRRPPRAAGIGGKNVVQKLSIMVSLTGLPRRS